MRSFSFGSIAFMILNFSVGISACRSLPLPHFMFGVKSKTFPFFRDLNSNFSKLKNIFKLNF